tara:strand:- start:232 stop:384 length:153 start_codon:yes stop_codon:yes gene_type:complete
MGKSSQEFIRLSQQSLEQEQRKYIDDSFHYAKTRNTGAPKRNPQTNLNKL